MPFKQLFNLRRKYENVLQVRGLVCAPNGAAPRRFPLYTYSAKDFLRRRGYLKRFKVRSPLPLSPKIFKFFLDKS